MEPDPWGRGREQGEARVEAAMEVVPEKGEAGGARRDSARAQAGPACAPNVGPLCRTVRALPAFRRAVPSAAPR